MTGRVNVGGVEIDVRADGSLLIADLKRAEAQAQAFATRASGAAQKVKKDGFDPLGRAVGDVRAQMLMLASVGALTGLTAQAVKAADAFTGMRSRLSLVVRENENLLQIEEKLAQLALKNRADLNATVSLYTRLRTARKDLDDATTTQILDAWSKTLVISGANATEAASATLQFAQAMGSGKLQGAELTAVLENNSRASALIAEKMGVPIGALKKLGEEGKLTTEILVDIFTNAGALDNEFGKITMTVGQAGTNFNTAFTRVIGLLDQSTGSTKALAGWIDSMAQSLIAFGVSLGGPLAEAEAAFQKLADAQNAVVADTDKLKEANDKLTEAIEKQGPAAQAAATAELSALNDRITKNKELIGVYRAQALQKLQQARDEIATKQKTGGALDRLLYYSPQTAPGRIKLPDGKGGFIESTPGPGASPRYAIGRQEDLFGNIDPAALEKLKADPRFGDREKQIANAKKQIEAQLRLGIALTDAQRELNDYFGNLAESELRLSEADQFLKDLDAAIAGGTTVGGGEGGGDKPGGTTSGEEKAKKLRLYVVALEEYRKTISEIRAADASGFEKSRAAVQAILDYVAATNDLATAQEEIISLSDVLSGGDWGILHTELARVAKEIEEATEKIPTIKDLAKGLGKDVPGVADLPDYTFKKSGTDEYFEEVKNATKRALFDAFASGDYGDVLENVLADSAADGLGRAVDRLVDLLFQIDWGSLFSSGEGGGDLLGSIGKAFGGLFGGAKAGGGHVKAGQRYMVGELGPEPFIPAVDGFIAPNRVGAVVGGGSLGGAGGQSVNVGGAQVVINGNLDGVTMDQLKALLDAFARGLPDAIDKRVTNRIGRGAY